VSGEPGVPGEIGEPGEAGEPGELEHLGEPEDLGKIGKIDSNSLLELLSQMVHIKVHLRI
jgi:hypothetical protein